MVSSQTADDEVRLTDRISIGVLMSVVPRDLVDEVIAYTGSREIRSRLLPSHVVVYYVIALALFFGEGYEEVMRRLSADSDSCGIGLTHGRFLRRVRFLRLARGSARNPSRSCSIG